MSDVSPALVDRIVLALIRSGAVRSSSDLVRRHLGLGLVDESLAARLLDPVLGRDPRLLKTAEGWAARPGAQRGPGDPALDAPYRAVAAPLAADGAWAEQLPLAGEPLLTVALGGQREVERYERLSGREVGGPTLALATAARRLRGYRGPADPYRIAEHLGAAHLEGETLEDWVAAVGACWEQLRAELLAEDVTDVVDLERSLAERLEPASFADKDFSAETLAALPEGPGVYLFRDRHGRALYVGQSGQLRSRVGSYFAGPPRDGKDREIRSLAHALAVAETETGLDAWIDETRAIRRLHPRLNVRRRVSGEPPEDGVIVVPAPLRPGRGVLYAVWGGALAGRWIARASEGHRRRAVERALGRRVRSPGRRASEEAAVLAGSWARAHPGHRHFRLGIDGDEAGLARALESYLAGLDEGTRQRGT